MSIVLPKASRGYRYPRLFHVEMNDFDVERLLPSLFYLVVTRGRQRGRGSSNDPKDIERYTGALARHPSVENFDSAEGRRLLEQWVRTAVVKIGRAGRGRREEQMEYVQPLTLLAYKPGFPAQTSRQRDVHTFLYGLLLERIRECDSAAAPKQDLAGLFQVAFGAGVHLDGAPTYDGRYDGSSSIDLQTLLCLYFLDGFEISEAAARVSDLGKEPALPAAARVLADDVLLFVLAYKDRMPPLELTRALMALIAFGLFVYTVRLHRATNELTRTGELPAAMRTENGLAGDSEIYADFTRERGGPSDELARACTERDLEELRRYFASSLRLRTIDRFVELRPEIKTWLDEHPTPVALQHLHELASDGRVQARAESEIEQIRFESVQAAGDGDTAAIEAAIQTTLRHNPGDALGAAVELLVVAQEKRATQNLVSWYWSVAGLGKRFGFLSGNLRGRRNWRYAMSDDLLDALVQRALIHELGPDGLADVRVRDRLRLSEFLDFLAERYGVLVDRPPDFLDDAHARAAASRNLEALRRRLRQMGFFEELSDDFNAQYLRNPEPVGST